MTTDSLDRPALTDVVTPAMLLAGAAVAARYVDMEWEAIRDYQRNMILTEIFKAMARCSPSRSERGPFPSSAV